MGDLTGLIERIRSQNRELLLLEAPWQTFLDQIRACGEKLEGQIRSLNDDREQLLAIIDLIPVAFFVKDHKSRFFLMNRACEDQWGMAFADLRDTDASHLFPADQMEQFLATDRSIFDNHLPVEFEETFWSAAQQANRVGYTFKRPMYDAKGDPLYLVCVTLDITDRKLAEAALQDSEARFRGAIENSPNPMMMHAEGGDIIMISAALTAITGYTATELPTIKVWTEKAYGARAERMQRRIDALYDLTAVRHEGESSITTASGETRFWDVQSQPLAKLPDGRRVVLSLGVDVTDRKRMQRELHALATTDSLTDLPNRRQFLARLSDELVKVRQPGSPPSSLLMLDLDFFKRVNDMHGHAAGDAALKHFARLIRNNLRANDTAGRIGGEEFAVILSGTAAVDARAFADRLRKVVADTPFVLGGVTIFLSVSIGISVIDRQDPSDDASLIRADEALYRAKRAGRNCVEMMELPPHTRDDRLDAVAS